MGLEPKLDRLGNVVVVKPGTQGKGAKRVMLSAHMDEVGLIVANVTEEGFLRPLPIGGVDPRVIISKRVLCGDDAVPGVIGAMAIHLQTAEDRKRVLGYDDIYVDIGAKDKAEAQAKCPMGTYITFDTDFVTFGDGFVSAKALDDRVGCYTLLKVLEGTYPCDVVAVFSSQEEVGCRGRQGRSIRPGTRCGPGVGRHHLQRPGQSPPARAGLRGRCGRGGFLHGPQLHWQQAALCQGP